MAIRRTVIHDDHHLVAATDKGQGDSTAPSSPGMRKGEYLDMKDSWSADSCTPTTQACQAF